MGKGGSHGGAREGAGRKPKYLTDNQTQSVRVPKTHKDDIERMILLIDSLVEQGFTITQIEQLLKDTFNK